MVSWKSYFDDIRSSIHWVHYSIRNGDYGYDDEDRVDPPRNSL